MCSYAHMLGKSTPKMAAIFVIVRKANSEYVIRGTSHYFDLIYTCKKFNMHYEAHFPLRYFAARRPNKSINLLIRRR